MSAANRAALIKKIHRTLKAAYPKFQLPIKDRPLAEHILYACCLENSTSDQASEAFGKLQTLYIEWNEVRVSSTKELAEVMDCLTDPTDAAHRIRRTLHNLYEAFYDYDIDFLTKENLGKAQKTIKSFQGKAKKMLDFVVDYVTQNGLGGHCIPLNPEAYDILLILDIISKNERRFKKVPGLERTISKNKGAEFGALMHAFSVDFAENPYDPKLQALLLKINPICKDSLPVEPVEEPETDKSSEEGVPEKPITKSSTPAEKPKKSAKKKVVAKKKAVAKKKTPAKSSTKKATAKTSKTKQTATKAKKKTAAKRAINKKKST
jgi:endonuclease-3